MKRILFLVGNSLKQIGKITYERKVHEITEIWHSINKIHLNKYTNPFKNTY